MDLLPKSRVSVMLVDDHILVRRGFKRMLEDDSAIEVVAEAGDGQEAIDTALRSVPDVVIMDFALPSMNGAVATRRILAAQPTIAVLILSMHSEPTYVHTCLEAGATGYLLKNAMDLELVNAVKELAAGRRVLDPRLVPSVSGEQASQRRLTTRELEILQLIVHGKSNKDIAAVLNLSANTVAVHRNNIMQAASTQNAAELVVYAIRNGLVSIA